MSVFLGQGAASACCYADCARLWRQIRCIFVPTVRVRQATFLEHSASCHTKMPLSELKERSWPVRFSDWLPCPCLVSRSLVPLRWIKVSSKTIPTATPQEASPARKLDPPARLATLLVAPPDRLAAALESLRQGLLAAPAAAAPEARRAAAVAAVAARQPLSLIHI